MKHSQIVYRWHEGKTTTINGYVSMNPFDWHWLAPKNEIEERTLYMADVRYKRKFKADIEFISRKSWPWKKIARYSSGEFVIRAKVRAFKVGTDIEEIIHSLDEYLNFLYLIDPIEWSLFDEFRRKLEKLWEKRTIDLCMERFLSNGGDKYERVQPNKS